jgi:Na+-transporting methylmalonyl-CoA/oxaloacetate decarboxylase gamma subunit
VLDVVLFALKIAFLVLLFLFVFLVVRRTVGDVSGGAARPAPAPAPRPAPAAAPPAAAVTAAPFAPAPSNVPEATPAERRKRREKRHTERTMPGESLDLMAHVHPRLVVAASPVLAAGVEIMLEGWIMIGRSPTSDLVLNDPFVSQTHARVVPRGQLHFVEDLGSTNGTFVNGREVIEAQLMLDSELRIGETIFRYEE